LEGHGREEIIPGVDLSRTVGWFTTVYPVHLQLAEQEQTGQSILAVKKQLRAIPNRGIGYSVLRYLSRDEELTATLQAMPNAKVAFNYLGQFDQSQAESAVFTVSQAASGATRSPHSRRSHLLEVNSVVADGQLRITWTYSANVHLQATIEKLAQAYLAALQKLIAHCQLPEVLEARANLIADEVAEAMRGAEGVADASSYLVPLNNASTGTPLFLVHPVGGVAHIYSDLAHELSDRPIYALQSRGVADNNEPLEYVEDMATLYVEAIRTVQSEGPYLLGGWSFGGLVALEMAQQLKKQGQEVEFLALLDTPAQHIGGHEPTKESKLLHTFASELIQRFGIDMPNLQELTETLDTEAFLHKLLDRAKRTQAFPPHIGIEQLRRFFTILHANDTANCRYETDYYAGTLSMFRAVEDPIMGDKPLTFGWDGLADAVNVRIVPGGHHEMVFPPHVYGLAKQMREALDEVEQKK
ncbi:MAG: alpha/beta fold hydrolase, partial [Tumebacillaceae bacterium]